MPQPSPDDSPRAANDGQYEDPHDEAPREADVLDQIVRATIVSAESQPPITSEEMAALKAVASRWGDVALTLDPIAVELVEAIILANYGQLNRSPEQWRAASTRIAKHLVDSPATNARLNNLWRRLIESM
jgi:hypothetical protein